jgi:hypothetical protein
LLLKLINTRNNVIYTTKGKKGFEKRKKMYKCNTNRKKIDTTTVEKAPLENEEAFIDYIDSLLKESEKTQVE